MVILLEEVKKIIIIELSVPWEDRYEEASERKATKFQDLVHQCRDKGWQAWLFPVEVGYTTPTDLGIAGSEQQTAARRLGEAGERASRWLWNRREEWSWKPGEGGQ
ncbi:Bone morphogenetic protein 5 [Dissostichus eleginoides]|uniref:Bone morphogenetic protein 5 n=1 Tax=Dissostichus eleginoides TaxID=100907 RepID=A0AAD9F9C2_DISEL|nr:Bone morphogenetic protein 5 [Dissostichus eleginoides]